MKKLSPRLAAALVFVAAAAGICFAATTSPNMGMTVPVSGDPGPTYATNITNALNTIDAHDHTTGKGTKVLTAGINVNADLEMNLMDLTEVRTIRFDPTAVTIVATDRRGLYQCSGEACWIDENGLITTLTVDGAVNSAVGSIGGMASTTAAVTYSNATKTFSFTQNTGHPANGDFATVRVARNAAAGKGPILTSNAATAADYNLIFPALLPAGARMVTLDASGNVATGVAATGTETFATVAATTGNITTIAATTVGATTGNITTVNATTVNTATVAATGSVTGVGGIGIAAELGGYTKVCLATTATDTTPVNVGGCSFTGLPAGTYGIHCSVVQNTTITTAAAQLGLDFTGGSAIRAFCTQFDGTGTPVFQKSTAVSTDDGACVSFTDSASVTPATIQGVFTVTAAGSATLRLRSETTDDVSVENGGICTVARAL